MFVVTVTFVIKPYEMARFMPLMSDNARQSLEDEPGCKHFDVCTSPDRPDEVFLYELYEDEAAFRRHLTLPHYLEFAERTAPFVAEKTVKTYTLLKDRSQP